MKIKLGDIIIVLLTAAAAVALLLSAVSGLSGELTAVVLVDGEEMYNIDLSSTEEYQEIELEDLDVVIMMEGGRIAFKSSSCPDKTCINTGWLDNAGDIAVCLPNRVVVKVIGESSSDIDVIAE